jgi:hypothetical protein
MMVTSQPEDEWIGMVDTWIDVEEEPMVMDSILDDEMMKFDSSDSTAGVTEDTDDDNSAGENGSLAQYDEDDDTNIISHIDVTNVFDTIQHYITIRRMICHQKYYCRLLFSYIT